VRGWVVIAGGIRSLDDVFSIIVFSIVVFSIIFRDGFFAKLGSSA